MNENLASLIYYITWMRRSGVNRMALVANAADPAPYIRQFLADHPIEGDWQNVNWRMAGAPRQINEIDFNDFIAAVDRAYLYCFDNYVSRECRTDEERDILRSDVESFWVRLNAYMTPQRPRAYGLAVGRIQSGKTRNYIGLALKAIDWGYNVIVILTSNNTRLAVQTYDRVRDCVEDLHINHTDLSLVPDADVLGNRHPIWVGGNFRQDRIHVAIVMKHTTWLDNISRWIERNNAGIANMKLLFIDDESDNGTPNANAGHEDEERTAINRRICDIVGSVENGPGPNYPFGRMIYAGYTATPFANVLQEDPTTDPLCPDCMKPLKTSSKYFGFRQIFGGPGEDCNMRIVRPISEDDNRAWIEPIQGCSNVVSADLRRQFNFAVAGQVEDIREAEWTSLKHAIQWAFCTAAARRVRRIGLPENDVDRGEIKNRWTTMLFHISERVRVDDEDRANGLMPPHLVQQQLVQRYINHVMEHQNDFVEECRALWAAETHQFSRQDFEQACDGYGEIDDYPPWECVVNELREWFLCDNGIHVKVIQMNSRRPDPNNPQPDYWDFNGNIEGDALWIICGGNAISRGLTLEGLTVSYFARTVNYVDTMTQMGRWFGYRKDYELLPRIWMRNDLIGEMKEACKSEELLHESLEDVSNGDGGVPASIRTGVNIVRIRYFGMRLTGRDANQIEFTGSSSSCIFKHVNDIGDRGWMRTNMFLGNCGEAYPVQVGSTRPFNTRHTLFWRDVNGTTVADYITHLLNDDYFAGVSIYEAEGLLSEIHNSQANWNVVVGNPVTDRRFEADAGRFANLGIRNNPFRRTGGMEVQIGTGQLTSGAFLARMPDELTAQALENLNNPNVVEGDMRHVRETFELASENEQADRALVNPTLLIDFTHGDDDIPFVQVSFYWHGHCEGAFVSAMVGPRLVQNANHAVHVQGQHTHRAINRLPDWNNKPNGVPHRAIRTFLALTGGNIDGVVTVNDLANMFAEFDGGTADHFRRVYWGSLKTNKGNAWGEIFAQEGRGANAQARLVDVVKDALRQHPNWFR